MLHLFIFIAVLLSLLYAVLILYYRDGWLRLPEYRADNTLTPITKVSILIPARNEEANIGPLLKDIMAQYYPPELMEVIVIDDYSTDRTADIASSFKGVTYISLSDFTEGKSTANSLLPPTPIAGCVNIGCGVLYVIMKPIVINSLHHRYSSRLMLVGFKHFNQSILPPCKV